MTRRGVALVLCPWVLACGLALSAAAEPATVAPWDAQATREQEDEEEDSLQSRLTEREDKRRPVEPFRVDLGGRPLTLGGEVELELGYLQNQIFGAGVDQPDRLLLESAIELEAFYSFGPILSLFAQLQLGVEEDLLRNTPDDVSDQFAQIGELWLISENIAGTHLNLDIGNLDFEDDRRWWWDDELAAVRVAYEKDPVEISFAVARELVSDRFDRAYIDPEHDGVLRLIGEASWDYGAEHSLQFFVLHQDDDSETESPGEIVSNRKQDDSDGNLTWIGARATGAFASDSHGIFGYWLDAAGVVGDEHFIEFDEISASQSEVEDVTQRDVSGWGLDGGLLWILPFALEPRVFAGYAFGSGDGSSDTGADHSFRQTGIQANEAGFGGVERFPSYGVVLDPELSNLGILTLGAGLSLLRASSLDLVYHYYRLAKPTESLRDTRLEFELDDRHRDLGHGLDLVLALEEWERFELDLVAAGFRAGSAFGDEQGTWSFGGFVALRYAF